MLFSLCRNLCGVVLVPHSGGLVSSPGQVMWGNYHYYWTANGLSTRWQRLQHGTTNNIHKQIHITKTNNTYRKRQRNCWVNLLKQNTKLLIE
jgi:hypothetical protein